MAPLPDRQAFATRLTQAMDNANVDRRELATRVGAHPNRVADWARGTRWPAVNHLVAAATTLNVSVDWLLTGHTGAGPSRPASTPNREAVDVARDLAILAPRLVPLAERARRATGRL